MKINNLVVAAAGLLASSTVLAGGGTHWGYDGHEGPQHWGSLSTEFATCSSGKTQSPVNIEKARAADLASIEFNYRPSAVNIVNNGHTVQVNYDKGSYITVDGGRFDLLQFHFHSPSENTINGKAADMEVHLVHKNAEGKLAVVGVMLNAGQTNKVLSPVWGNMPAAHKNKTASGKINAADLLPASQGFYRFEGSLTTPPCSEGVKWFVMKDAIPVSRDQVGKFVKVVGHNARPVQATNSRSIKASK